MGFHKFAVSLIGAPVVLLGTACANTPASDFYMLSPMSEAAVSAQAANAGKPMFIGVGPVTIPEYLDRPNIVTRSSPNRLQVDEFHRWGGSLKGNLLRVVAQNLSLLLGTDDVVIYPWGDPVAPDYRVRVSIRRFDGSLGGSVELDARWIIISSDDSTAPVARRSLIRETVESNDHEALVVASSRALEAMSREIAEEISNVHSSTR